MMPSVYKRGRHSVYLRVLSLVDVMAPIRNGLTASQITELVNEKIGDNYTTRTIQRDLLAMESIGYATRVTPSNEGCRGGRQRDIWKLNLISTQATQAVAYEFFG